MAGTGKTDEGGYCRDGGGGGGCVMDEFIGKVGTATGICKAGAKIGVTIGVTTGVTTGASTRGGAFGASGGIIRGGAFGATGGLGGPSMLGSQNRPYPR
jgi:hypothetical protein